jgi:hypothetical protein
MIQGEIFRDQDKPEPGFFLLGKTFRPLVQFDKRFLTNILRNFLIPYHTNQNSDKQRKSTLIYQAEIFFRIPPYHKNNYPQVLLQAGAHRDP